MTIPDFRAISPNTSEEREIEIRENRRQNENESAAETHHHPSAPSHHAAFHRDKKSMHVGQTGSHGGSNHIKIIHGWLDAMTAVKLCALVILLASMTNHGASKAMVIDALATSMPPVTSSRKPSSTRISSSPRQVRIRHTLVADLDAISTMLAMEAVPSRDTWNWNDDMERLRAKSKFRQQLGHRLAAIEEGRETANRLCDAQDFESEIDSCLLLWKHDNFRTKIKTAVAHSQEENAWIFHNFDQPPSSCMLNHAMISVEDTSTRGLVGFCEVAWLPSPSSPPCRTDCTIAPIPTNKYEAHKKHDSEDLLKTQPKLSLHGEVPMQQLHPSCAPAIVNLVISSSHRRMGIASRLLNFVSKYTRIQWNCPDDDSSISLSLYVHPNNEAAVKLYNMKGFTVLCSDSENGLLYLTKRQ